jgi:hypothetical protein
MNVYSICGFLTIITPYTLFFLGNGKNLRNFLHINTTISNYSLLSNRKKNLARLALFLNGIWSIGFFNGLWRILNIGPFSIFGFLSMATVLLFFITGLTLSQKTRNEHRIAGVLLMFFLTLIKLFFGFYIGSTHVLVGTLSLCIGLTELIGMGYVLVRDNFVFNGVYEIVYTTILSFWVFALSLYMII